MAWWQIILCGIGLTVVFVAVAAVVVAAVSWLSEHRAQKCTLCPELAAKDVEAATLRARMECLGITPANRCGRVHVAQTIEAGYYETVAQWDEARSCVDHAPVRVTKDGVRL